MIPMVNAAIAPASSPSAMSLVCRLWSDEALVDAISRPDASTAVTRRRMLVGFRFMAVPSEPLVWNAIVGHGA